MTIRLEIIEKGEALYGTEEQSAMEETEEFGMDEKRNELLRSILSDESDGRVEVTDSGGDGDAVNKTMMATSSAVTAAAARKPTAMTRKKKKEPNESSTHSSSDKR